MLFLKRLFESYLGVPPSRPGQGTAWRIETRPLGPEGWPDWIVFAVGVLAAAFVVLIYFREGARLSRARRMGLAALRLVALLLVLAMISQATLAVDRTGLPVVAVVIDDSASMSLVEESKRDSKTARSRLELVHELVAGNDGRFLESLSGRFRLRLYRFSADAVPIDSHEDEEQQIEQLANEVRSLTATGDETRPATAVQRVLDDLRGLAPSGIVVFTDGVATTGDTDRLSAVAAVAGRRRVPLYPVGVGSDGPARDLELYDVIGDEVAFLGDPVRVTARFRTFGLKNEPITLTLTDAQSGEVLARTTVPAEADGRANQSELTFLPESEGDFDVKITARTDVPERNQENNTATRRVSVRKQRVRVLLADHVPRYEFRYLKALLEREPTIDLDTVLQEADLGYSAQDRTALERFPLRREEILAYDVIILGDLDPGLLGPDVLTALADFVRMNGGGLIGIAGSEFFPARYVGTPIEPLMPVDLTDLSTGVPEALLADPFRPELTLAGRQSPMFRLADSEQESQAVWDSLPGMYWRADASTLRPGAIALAEVADVAARPRPLITLQRFGAGKVLLHLTDETWRWRLRVGDTYFGQYWLQAIRYFGRGALSARAGGAELISDRRTYAQGDPVQLRIRFSDERLIPSGSGNVVVVVEDRSGVRREVELSRVAELSDVYEGRIDQLPEGAYHAWVREPVFPGSPPTTDFRVEPPERELAHRAADIADLKRAAERSGGKYFDLANADDLPRQLPAGRPVRMTSVTPQPLWNRAELLLALGGVLTAEWVLRKRSRLP